MILRKPYALFIKSFKIMHLLLTAGVIYLMYRTAFVLSFLNESILQPSFNLASNVSIELVDYNFYLIPFMVLFVTTIILVVLIYKKKPFKIYIVAVVAFLAILFFNAYLDGYLSDMERHIKTAQSLSLIRDLVLICLVIEGLFVVKFFISGIGFDVTNFDFLADLEEMEIEEADREEVEVSFDVDVQKRKRETLGAYRTFKYYYAENKFRVHALGVILLLVASFSIYNLMPKRGELAEGDLFTVDNFLIGVEDSYLTRLDFRGNEVIDEELYILVLNVKVRSQGATARLERARTRVEVGNFSFYHRSRYREALRDLGVVYDGQRIGNEFENYLLVFEIPNAFAKRTMYFRYVGLRAIGNLDFSQSVTITPKKTDEVLEEYLTPTEEIIYFREPIIYSYIEISDFLVQDEFALIYNNCVASDLCYRSLEYLRPGYNSNYSKVLMRLRGKFVADEEVKHLNENLESFINKYGRLRYQLDGRTYTARLNNSVRPIRVNREDEYYFEIPAKAQDAENLELFFRLRNYAYKHPLE